ncbi:MAG: hypothetical protein NTY38_17520 [Acidobacteria bacterium]|nr:hypothetical protein [Acidobacteriota bacterium]
MRLIFALLLAWVAIAAEDPRDMIRKSVSPARSNWEQAKNYTYVERVHFRELDDDGTVKRTRKRAHEVMTLYGQGYRKLVERDEKPLSPEEARAEEEKLNRTAAERRSETPEKRQKRAAEFARERQKMRAIVQEIPEAFDFRLVGSEAIGGRDNWVIEATPHPGYHAQDWRARMFSRFQGRIWIDKAEYQWTRCRAEAVDTFSLFLFLARVYKGSRIELEQRKVNDEIWMPTSVFAAFSARFAIFKKLIGDEKIEYLDFRRFQADSHIVPAAETPSR